MPESPLDWSVAGIACLSLLIWIYLLLFHGGFWRADQRLEDGAEPEVWPTVTAIVPARDEAEVIERAVTSLLSQNYPGEFHLIVVDDGSSDGTADLARAAAEKLGAGNRLTIVTGTPLPEDWTGKMWAVANGVRNVGERDFLLLTDADIEHDPANLRRLAAKAVTDRRDMVSLMVRLHASSFWERLLIPAFVFFFQKLYPFPRVNNREAAMAGAAGGCVLVRKKALEQAGGFEAIKSALIDDCALARRIKKRAAIWLGLTENTYSIRPYDGLGGIWRMVARTAFTQLNYSALLLLGTLVGMVLIYLAPPVVVVWGIAGGNWLAAGLGGGALALMLLAYWPTAKLYGPPFPEVLLLPLAGLLYTAMTFDSALRHWRGAGGGWKGRTYTGATPYGGN
jgi:hopene-associated glycosyltransferase HpnB